LPRQRAPCHGAPRPRRIGQIRTNTRADFDLRTQEFRADLARKQRLAVRQHFGWRIVDDVARRPVNQEIFLLDTERELRLGDRGV
jgi:hypothetical protein